MESGSGGLSWEAPSITVHVCIMVITLLSRLGESNADQRFSVFWRCSSYLYSLAYSTGLAPSRPPGPHLEPSALSVGIHVVHFSVSVCVPTETVHS